MELAGVWDARGRWRHPDVALRAHAIHLLAGAAAEREILEYANAGDANDRREVRWLIHELGKSGLAAERLGNRLERFAASLARRHRSAIAELAEVVLVRHVMVGEVLAEAMERLLTSSPYLARHGAWARSEDAIAMAAEHGIATAKS